jgi:seryl-tRNA synthetase
VVQGLSGLITRHRERGTEVLRFPPVMNRRQVEKSGYLHSFPHLLGCVCGLHGDEAEIHAAVGRFNAGQEWTDDLSATDLVLTPAACYPLYPLAAARGAMPATGLRFDVESYCFRREATFEVDRLQAFRMREYVCMGSPDEAVAFRARWLELAKELADELALPYRIAPASDPFFGRAARIIAASQVEQLLKYEFLVPLRSQDRPTACMSFNYHRDHFGTTWGLRTESGDVAHTACVAFGMDRLALAMFTIHGIEPREWPARVRTALGL